MPSRALILCAVLIWADSLSAQVGRRGTSDPRFLSRTWSVQEGLPDSRVTAVLMGREGFIWVGTRRGLARFDGSSFRIYTHGIYPTLPSDEILALAEDATGTLWVGTQAGLVNYQQGRFTPVELAPTVHSLKIRALLSLPGGGLLVSSTDSLYTLPGDSTTPDLHSAQGAQALTRASTGEIWALTHSLYQVGAGGFLPDTTFTQAEIERALTIDSAGTVWVSDISHLLVRRSPAGGRTYEAIPPSGGLPTGSIRALTTAADGAVWVAVDGGGVFRWNGRRFEPVALDSIAAGAVRVLCPAGDGSVWVGSLAGLTHVWPARFITHRTGRDLTLDFTWQILSTADSNLWLATNAGPARLIAGRPTAVPSQPHFPAGQLLALGQGSDGTIWLAFRGGEVGRYLEGRYHSDGKLPGEPTAEVRAILEDHKGVVWLGTDEGLYQWDSRSFHRLTEKDGLATRDVYVLRESDNGELWIGGANGLTRRDVAGQFHPMVRPEDGTLAGVEDLFVDGERLWITTFRDGLTLYTGGRLTALGGLVPGLLREAHRVMPDHLGFLWISSNLGLQRVRIADLLAVAAGRSTSPFIEDFDREDGLLSAEFNSSGGASGARTADGHLWFPSPVGVVEVDPGLFRADSAPPRTVIDQVLLDDRDVTGELKDRLSWRGGRLTIRYTAVSVRKNRSFRYRYRLEGVDPAWIEVGTAREAIYPDLRSGHYLFSVQAGLGGGLWPAAPTTLEISLAPRLYEQKWFLILIVTLAAGSVTGWYRWRTRRLVLQSRRLEQLVTARTSELEASRDELDQRVRERTAQLEAELTERQRLERQLVQAQKLESVGRLAGGVAHDINNLMTAVLGYAQLVEDAVQDQPGLREDIQQIRLAGERAAGVSQQLLAFGRRQIFNAKVVNINETLLGLDNMLRRSVGASIELVLLLGEELWNVRVDPVQLEQVIINLVSNGRDAMAGGGKLWLETRDRSLPIGTVVGGVEVPAGDFVELTVRDSGTGIAPEVLPHIFEPFFTTKEVGQGSGLGLATSYGIVKQSGGHIIIESEWGVGTAFRILLPRSLEPSRGPDAAAQLPTTGGDETVLLVEDEPQLRALAGRFLRRIGYTVLEAADGEEALRLVAETRQRIDAMITDLIMPRMGGLELATRMRADGQRCRILMVSGYVEREVPPELIRQPGVAFLAKPFRLQELARRLRTLLDGPPEEV